MNTNTKEYLFSPEVSQRFFGSLPFAALFFLIGTGIALGGVMFNFLLIADVDKQHVVGQLGEGLTAILVTIPLVIGGCIVVMARKSQKRDRDPLRWSLWVAAFMHILFGFLPSGMALLSFAVLPAVNMQFEQWKWPFTLVIAIVYAVTVAVFVKLPLKQPADL